MKRREHNKVGRNKTLSSGVELVARNVTKTKTQNWEATAIKYWIEKVDRGVDNSPKGEPCHASMVPGTTCEIGEHVVSALWA
jgi:hypothetical protein